MRLTTKGRYAVAAMVDLAATSQGQPVALADIADRQNISLSYLEQLFAKLRKAKLVESVRGPGGGYRPARLPSAISVAEIIRAVDDSICCDGGAEPLANPACATHALWSGLGRQIQLYLNSVSLADICCRQVPVAAAPVPAKQAGEAA